MRVVRLTALLAWGAIQVFAQPSIGAVSVAPPLIPVGTATTVLFTASITAPTVIAGSPNVTRVDATGRSLAVLGLLKDDGANGDAVAGDKVFSLRVTLNEATAGRVYLRSTASFPGLLQRIQSSIIAVDVGGSATPLVINATVTPTPNAAGWHRSNATVSFSCTGGTGGSAMCPGMVIVSTDTVGQVVTGTAQDGAGNTVAKSVTIKLDKTAPVIAAVTTPATNAAGWINANATLTFVCTDPVSGIESCPAPVAVSTEGAKQVFAGTARDFAGNSASTTGSVSLDKTPPVLTITSPANGSTLGTSPAVIAGTVADSLSGLAGLTCNGIAVTVTAGSFTCNAALTIGSNTVTVRATDVAGNVSTQTLTLILSTGPSIQITSPANLSYLNISPTTVNGTVNPPTATVTINGLAAPVANGNFSVALPLAEGPNTVTATATSTTGGIGTATIEVTLDTTPPRVTITSPPDKFVTTDAAISVAGNVNDIVVGTVNTQQAQVTVNSVAAQVANRTFLAMNVPLNLGVNVIQAVGRDRVGNAGTTQITVTRQAPSAAPQIRLISGNNQTGTIGSILAAPLVAALVDAAGAPVPNKPVIFKVTQNSGIVSSGGAPAASIIVNTNASGQAQAQWTLGDRSGAGGNTVEAYSVGFDGTAIYTATGTQGQAGKIVVDTGNNQIGVVNQTLPKPMIAVVVDSGNNRLANVPVTFTVKQGGGNFGGQQSITSNTDSDGRVGAILTLGFQEGNSNNLVEASFPQNQGFPAAFTASGRAAGVPANTSISGVVLDNSNVPIPGVTIRAVLSNLLTSNSGVIPTVAAVQTNAQGQFSISGAPVGFVKLLVDGGTAQRPGKYPTLDYDMVTIAGQSNTLGMPVYLLPLSTANQLCVTATTGGGTLTIPEAPGFSLTFAPSQVTFPGGSKSGCVSVTVVHPDKVPMVPGFGQQPRFIVTIQPAGAIFNPPAPITLPNVDGLKPRAVTEMYSFDHDIGSFVAIGTGAVSDDGQVIRSSPGVGVLKAGWHCGGDPSARGTVADCPPCTFCQGANTNSVACIPDPNQMRLPCQSTFNNCIKPGTGFCGVMIISGQDVPNGQCVGGQLQPDGTPCNSTGSTQAICLTGVCTGTGNQCPVDCADANPLTLDYCANGVCFHVDPDNNFCVGRADNTPCGICRSGATCQSGICSGGNPVGGSCGPCMVGGACNATGQCVGATPAPNGTACGSGGICTNGTCRVAPPEIRFLDNNNTELNPPISGLGVSKFVTTRDLTATDSDNFKLQVIDTSVAQNTVNLQLTSQGARNSGSLNVTLSRLAMSSTFRSDHLRLVSDSTDQAAASTKTLLVEAGSSVNAAYTGARQEIIQACKAPGIKSVSLKIYILRNKPQAAGGTPVITASEVSADIASMNDRYAQVCVTISGSIAVVDPPPGVDLSDGLSEFTTPDPTIEEKALLDGLASPAASDIELFYVNYLGNRNTLGEAFAPYYFTNPIYSKYLNTIILGADLIVANRLGYQVAAHELGHILLNLAHETSPGVPAPSTNLMYVFSSPNAVDGPKRLTPSQETTIRTNQNVR